MSFLFLRMRACGGASSFIRTPQDNDDVKKKAYKMDGIFQESGRGLQRNPSFRENLEAKMMRSLAKSIPVLVALGALSAPVFAKGDWVEPTLEEMKAKKSKMLSHRPDIVACIQAAGSVEKVYVCIEAGFADVKHKKK